MKIGGKTFVDGQRKIAVTITAEDVDNAIPSDPTQCAIAQAMRRSKKGIDSLSIGASVVYVTWVKDTSVVERYNIDPNDRSLIRTFDEQGKFPCGYTVHLMPLPESRRIGARKGEVHGTNVRSGKGNSAANRAARRPTRHVAAPA